MARKPKTRAPYRMVSPPTWELARAAYLGGKTAAEVAVQFNIGLHNLRQNIYQNGWSKRALADARAGADPDRPPPPDPIAGAAPAAATARASPDVIETVLRRAREALTAGRGTEASTLLKAAREYVIVQQDVQDARDAVAHGVNLWDTAQPARAGEATEPLMIQTLHSRWSRLSDGELAERVDPEGRLGLAAYIEALRPKDPRASRKGSR